MKKLNFAAAALLAVSTFAANAATLNEDSYFDDAAFVYEFGARSITAGDALGTFSFLLNGTDFGFTSLAGAYLVSGDISGTKYAIREVKINGATWNLGAGSSNVNLGSLTFPAVSSIQVTVFGDRLGSGSNFQGSLVMTPVPEPTTYALLLAGLGVVGFVASRRKSV